MMDRFPILVSRLRESGFTAPVLSSCPATPRRSRCAGELPTRSTFLGKPFTPGVLSQKVREAMAAAGHAGPAN
jgi:hypothetical protein